MSLIANQTGYRISSQTSERSLPTTWRRQPRYSTTAIERVLLAGTIVLLPLQDHIPPVAGFSILWIIFAVLAGYVVVNRLTALNRIWLHPAFLAAYTLLVLSSLVEFSHPLTSYSYIFRAGQMIAGAVLVASLCRDRRALRAAVYGYVLVSIWLSILLYLTSYGILREAAVADFNQASQLRVHIMDDNPLRGNANRMAFTTAQGVVVALALVLTTRTPRRRYLYLGIFLFCLVATFLPMSRGGVVIVIISCATIMFASGTGYGKIILTAGIMGASIMVLVPDAVWSRMTFSTQVHKGRQEARASVYTKFVEHFPEYGLTGVGAGNFWQSWAFRNGFIAGAHNSFFQVMIYWGLAGLLALIAVIWQAYRCLPWRCGSDGLALSLLGIAVSLLLFMMMSHNFYAKEFSLGLGLLVGARCWIWPQGVIQSAL